MQLSSCSCCRTYHYDVSIALSQKRILYLILILVLAYCRVWQTFLVILVGYTAWVSPFEFGFIDRPRGALAITDNVVNGFFFIDIVLTFFVAYLDKATYLLIDNRQQIARKYLFSWFVFDVISTIPNELARKFLPSQVHDLGFFNMLRLWRLRRVSSLFARYSCSSLSLQLLNFICFSCGLLYPAQFLLVKFIDYFLIVYSKFEAVITFKGLYLFIYLANRSIKQSGFQLLDQTVFDTNMYSDLIGLKASSTPSVMFLELVPFLS